MFQNETQMPAVKRKTPPSTQFFLFTDPAAGWCEERCNGMEDDGVQSDGPLYREAVNAPEMHTKVPNTLA